MAKRTRQSLSDELRERAVRALISFAVFRWESAVTLAATLILSVLIPDPFRGVLPFWRWWFWIIIGTIAEALIVVTSIYDPQVRERVVGEMFREKFNPREIASAECRLKITRALEYREQMEVLLQRARDGALRTHLEATVSDVSDWISNMFSLAQRLDDYKSSTVLQQDLASVPAAIQDLQKRLQAEKQGQVRAQLEQTIKNKQAQLAQLQHLDSTMERAELQLDDTLSAMGTIYAQMQLIGAKDIDSGRAQRLREDIGDQIDSLHDIVQTMDEVYQSSETPVPVAAQLAQAQKGQGTLRGGA
jgi:hypothetical protein